tara:strand:- start:516 stop:884 length:369 start_codon:yes stop_codon:yes gene_type:complete
LCQACKNCDKYPEEEKERVKLLHTATQIYANETNCNSDILLDTIVDTVLHKCNLPYLLIYLDDLSEKSGVGEEAFCICTWQSAGMYANNCKPIEIIKTANVKNKKDEESLIQRIYYFVINLF